MRQKPVLQVTPAVMQTIGRLLGLTIKIKVMIVVCIILYYEKASASKNIEGNDEEGGEFLSKKEEN